MIKTDAAGRMRQLGRLLLRHKLMTIMTLVVLVIFVDSISHWVQPESSWFSLVVRTHSSEHVTKAKDYLSQQKLQTDEALIAERLGVELQAQNILFPGDPFFRLNDVHFGPRRVTQFEEGTRLRQPHYVLEESVAPFMTDPTDDVLYKALYCDREHYDRTDRNVLLSLVDDIGGYGDTHALLGLRITQELGCIAEQDVSHREASIVERLVRAQFSSDVDDLFVERIVVLYWAGAGERVEDEWITRIEEAQRDDGGYAYVSGGSSDPHTTALAALALTYHSEGKSHQSVILGL